ncbi:MAG: acyltransferase [Prevotella sp.]|nr:acyltransferase [Prevotella sp.]
MNKYTNYNNRLSTAITWLRFPLIFLIIMLHCYSVQRLEGDHETYFKVLYPFALWLGETGVPAYFFISGYLFFLSKKNYGQKLKDRIHTLLIPYILWNLLLLLFYLFAYALGHPLIIFNTSIADYNWVDYIRVFWDRGEFDNGNSAPILCPLWYIRNLIIMSVLSPLLYYVIKYTRELFLVAVAVWWMMTNNNAFTPQSILFFSLGGYFSIFVINPLKMVTERKRLFLTLTCLFAIADIFVHVAIGTPFNLMIHRMSLIFNIPALLIFADGTNKNGFNKSTVFLSQAAFIVFCIHYPIVLVLRKICIVTFANATDAIHIPLYFLCVILTTASSIVFYWMLDRYFPKAKSILTGNR